jgi:hypothetical protein
MKAPVICFGQQPCGFFPKRFLVAKIRTARRLQSEIGGEIVFFYHDSDHDPRETRTILLHRKTKEAAKFNFAFENKIQRKFSPLHCKRIPDGWQSTTADALPNYVSAPLIEVFNACRASNVADFCLEMYRGMGLLTNIRVVRSSDAGLRQRARDISDFFVDLRYQGETVRARFTEAAFKLHEGGSAFVTLPATPFTKEQVSPARETRFRWMQSVVHATHYVMGAGEAGYLHREKNPDTAFVPRDSIDRSDEAYAEIP